MAKEGKRSNINFRQTPKEFRAQHQTATFSAINRNIPYRMYQFSKNAFTRQIIKLKTGVSKFVTKIPKNARKVG